MSTLATELLQGREARCICGAKRPSTEREHLAFFEYRGPGSRVATERCRNCGYYASAHDPDYMEGLVHGRDGKRRPTVVEQGRCEGFETDPAGHAFDAFYDGCRGWE